LSLSKDDTAVEIRPSDQLLQQPSWPGYACTLTSLSGRFGDILAKRGKLQ